MRYLEHAKTLWLLVLTACLLGGWSSGGYDQYFSLDSSGNVVCAAPLQVTRLGVGGAPGSYTGTIKLYTDWAAGDVNGIEFSSGGSFADRGFYLSSTNYITGNGSMYMNLLRGNSCQADTFKNAAGTGAPSFLLGLSTAAGYGIGVGTTAPTTNAIDMYQAGTTLSFHGIANMARLINTSSILSFVGPSSYVSIRGDSSRFSSFMDLSGNTFATDSGSVFTLAAGTRASSIAAADGTPALTIANSTGEVTASGRVHLAGGADATGFNWDAGNVNFIDVAGASGTPNSSDSIVYRQSSVKIGATGAFIGVEGDFTDLKNRTANGAPTFTYGFLIDDTTVPDAPDAGYLAVYNETATGLLSVKNSASATTAMAFP